MKRIPCGTSGSPAVHPERSWDDMELLPPWRKLVGILAAGRPPRPIQAAAFGNLRVLHQRRNLIVAAPTNAGKTLVGLVVLLDAILCGHRAVLLEPLRALAREKYEELLVQRPALEAALGRPFHLRITTGDFRHDAEHLSAPPSDTGELVIATPERLDAIHRDPANDPWFAEVGAVVVDEAQLIRVPGRGATLEYLLTSLNCLVTPPRLVLLTAGLGNATHARDWLAPCDVVQITERFPPLRKEVRALAETEFADDAVIDFLQEALAEDGTQALVFVYQTRSAESLAQRLRTIVGPTVNPLAYHGQLSADRREEIRQSFQSAACRCVVTTTALALGVNLPATHVCVRDLTFPDRGMLRSEEILQMMGRAGRGDQAGHAIVLVRPTDRIRPEELAHALLEERLPELVSSLSVSDLPMHVLARLCRTPEQGATLAQLREFFGRSLGGKAWSDRVRDALEWLTDTRQNLASEDENGRFRPTFLGQAACRGVLPLPVAAGYARLIRDLLALPDGEEALQAWQSLDHLLVLELTYPHGLAAPRFSDRLAKQINAWMQSKQASYLHRCWMNDASSSRQLLSSLGVQRADRTADHQAAYLGLMRAILAVELFQAVPAEELERSWKAKGFMGIAERWGDDTHWLLAGIEKILDIRCFSSWLKDECQAELGRMRQIELALRAMRRQTIALIAGPQATA